MKVIGILCRSYGGSTITNLLLNSHPEIYGGSELKRLVMEGKKSVCAVHGRNCEVWSEAARASVASRPMGEFYRAIYDATGYTNIVDASKSLDFFTEDRLRENELNGAQFSFIYLNKHPLAHAASFALNRVAVSAGAQKTFAETRALLEDRHDEALSAVAKALGGVLSYVKAVHKRKHYLKQFGQVASFKLEEIIQAPEGLFFHAAEFFGVDPGQFSRDFEQADFIHPIGGNLGALTKVAKVSREDDERVVRYRNRGLEQDDKWQAILPPQMRSDIERLGVFEELCERMQYPRRIEELQQLLAA